MTCSVSAAPEQPEVVEIAFEQGNPVAINGERLDPVALVRRANALAGGHGFGRLDMIENRVVGIKSREIYETPGLLLLIKAHQELESLTLAADVLRYKRQIETSWADLVYQGLWFGPLKEALDGFLDRTQLTVSGSVRIRLHKGNATVIGRSSSESLYMPDMATYGADDRFDHRAAEGFIYMWGLAHPPLGGLAAALVRGLGGGCGCRPGATGRRSRLDGDPGDVADTPQQPGWGIGAPKREQVGTAGEHLKPLGERKPLFPFQQAHEQVGTGAVAHLHPVVLIAAQRHFIGANGVGFGGGGYSSGGYGSGGFGSGGVAAVGLSLGFCHGCGGFR